MAELVKTENTSYTRYEELLIRRDVLRKEAFHYQMEYLREFGELLTELFEARITCIEKKKIIAYCQKKINRGEKISKTDLDQYIDSVMKVYYDDLHEMLERNRDIKKFKPISEYDYRRIKAIYYRIAKLIHPDMNPSLKDDETVKDLWNRAVIAYDCNMLKELEDILVLVNGYLESINYKHESVDIPDIGERIAELNQEIEQIISTDPYTYKYLLADKEAVAEKKANLKTELADYQKYADELDEVIASFGIEKVIS